LTSSLWVWFCILAIAASAAKVFYIKKIGGLISNLHILFFSRLVTCLLLVPLYSEINIPTNQVFWSATLTAVVLTTLAGYAYIEALRRGALSIVAPIQATIPVFMVAIIALVYQDVPSLLSVLFLSGTMLSLGVVLLSSSNAYNSSKESRGMWQPILLSLLAALLYAGSTVLDRVAIASTEFGALNYTFIWNAISLMVLSVLMRGRITIEVSGPKIKWLLLVAISSALAFLMQQYAVQNSLYLLNGVTFVKSLVMLHIAILIVLGILFLGERPDKLAVLGSFSSLLFGIGLVLSSI